LGERAAQHRIVQDALEVVDRKESGQPGLLSITRLAGEIREGHRDTIVVHELMGLDVQDRAQSEPESRHIAPACAIRQNVK
jgi:hypothetical protein